MLILTRTQVVVRKVLTSADLSVDWVQDATIIGAIDAIRAMDIFDASGRQAFREIGIAIFTGQAATVVSNFDALIGNWIAMTRYTISRVIA